MIDLARIRNNLKHRCLLPPEDTAKLCDEIERLREIEAAAVEAYYLNGFHKGGCMCANCLLKLVLDERSTVLAIDRETVKRMQDTPGEGHGNG